MGATDERNSSFASAGRSLDWGSFLVPRHMKDDPSQEWFVRLRVDPTPYADDPPNADAYYRALGLYLVAWGRFEGHFVSALLQLRALGWADIPTEGMPIAWGKRADFWKRAFRELPQLAPIKPDAAALITDIILASRDRGIVVHSMWGGFVSTNPLAVEAISLKFEGKIFATANIALSLPTLEHMLLAANTLNARLIPISQFLGSLRPTPKSARPALRPRESLKIHSHPAKPKSGKPRPSDRRK
jgi:hypothetical protein